ncbi:DUF192 domain-containing protein [Bdellovibrio sp. HCB337]|uniref:DUF192 domain-containing protein n=1 Tax=Bdellovibrio sp. HCB337 TaxID=3394358 RepID=UPI0039A71723
MVSHWKFFVVSLCFLFAGSIASAKDVTFEKEKITLNGKTLTVEIAESPAQHEHGLMFRKNMAKDEGMLFIFKTEDYRYFWMKNTYIDLSIGYFDKDKTLVDIQEMRATSALETRPPSYPSAKPAMYALEMNKEWFKKNNVKIGHKFSFSSRRQ